MPLPAWLNCDDAIATYGLNQSYIFVREQYGLMNHGHRSRIRTQRKLGVYRVSYRVKSIRNRKCFDLGIPGEHSGKDAITPTNMVAADLDESQFDLPLQMPNHPANSDQENIAQQIHDVDVQWEDVVQSKLNKQLTDSWDSTFLIDHNFACIEGSKMTLDDDRGFQITKEYPDKGFYSEGELSGSLNYVEVDSHDSDAEVTYDLNFIPHLGDHSGKDMDTTIIQNPLINESFQFKEFPNEETEAPQTMDSADAEAVDTNVYVEEIHDTTVHATIPLNVHAVETEAETLAKNAL
ncbi:unnamed protein product [Ilex paraguariensis]|uniref:Uncharacterized protein n=1 Tax=Ilex paraguariensis TaxID=185542 RepID=A0ABC8UW71_9AQUA